MKKAWQVTRLGWFLVLLASVPLAALAGESIDRQWNVRAQALVSVDNAAGEIEVQGWKRNEVHLTGKLGDSVSELQAKATDSGLQIKVINQDKRNTDRTKLLLMVPAQSDLEATTVSANITISAINNEKLTAKSVSGDVAVQAVSRWVSLGSVSGDLNFSGETVRMSAESVSGDLGLSGVGNELVASTVSGDMVLSAGEVESAKLETVSGDVKLKAAVSSSGRLSVESMSGDARVYLPGKQKGQFKARTFSGRIGTDFGVVSSAKHGPGSHLDFTVGDSGAEIRIESFSGNISLQSD